MITVQVLGECEIFRGLPARDLEGMVGLCREEAHSRGSTILREGDQADTLYVLLQGMVGLRIHPPEGQEFMVGTVRHRGETFGWSALVEPRRYTAAAVCLEDCQVLAIPGAGLLAHLEKEPGLGFPVMRRLASIISSRLQVTRSHLASLLAPGVVERG